MKTKMNTTEKMFAERVNHVPQSFIREILKVASNPAITSFAGGLPNPAFFPVKELEQCATQVFQQQGMQALQYTATEGYYPLREFISHRYRQRYGIDIPPEQILITNGSQQALDLIGKIFINPGDQVLMERPTYLGALQCLSMFQPKFQEVTLNADDVDDLEEQLWSNAIKLFYCIPNFQNPTGIRYSAEVREQAMQVLNRYNTIVVEDDPYGDIFFDEEELMPLYSYAPEKTILLGSFSKSIAPGLRLGWMVASEEIIRKATIMKQASDLHSGNLTQHILYRFLTAYSLDAHIKKIQDTYRFQRDTMMSCLKQYFPSTIEYTHPQGGMFAWVTLPEEITARELLDKAIEQNIIFVPGDAFYASDPDTQTLRLNYSNVEEAVMRKAMNTLGGMVAGLVEV
ncbi:PLP-dependent aminotransferase family protein [Cytophaga aurantiaca]|uniref:aminotransferase-like domain-containing protein n=1 Tax=Cytophaga aurantiaca TaxID=29530 RepID=UPI00035DDF46|nr:PLP-dependent aminotransferase family protein [Cytophaga aurantiaca]